MPLTPIRWRTGAPLGRSSTLYQFVREFLWRAGGHCSRDELLAAMLGDPAVRERLERGQGFGRLLTNMQHSGEVVVDNRTIKATPRGLRRGAPGDFGLQT